MRGVCGAGGVRISGEFVVASWAFARVEMKAAIARNTTNILPFIICHIPAGTGPKCVRILVSCLRRRTFGVIAEYARGIEHVAMVVNHTNVQLVR